MPEDVVSQDEQITPEPKPEEPIAAAGNSWNGEKWEDRTPRDDQGRFARIRANLAKANQKTEFLTALEKGAVEPSDDMEPELWARARNNQLRNRTAGIEMPELPAEKTGDEAEGAGDAQAVELTPAEIAHNSAHEDLNVRLLARYETPEVKQLTSAMEYAAQRGATPYFFDQLGHIAADHENREAVLLHLGQNPEKLAAYSHLAPVQLKNVVHVLSQQLGAQQKPTAPPKPKPPDPVGARAATTAFDVNDESIDADTWARQRNESLAKRGRRN
jgi:hypothetical protein